MKIGVYDMYLDALGGGEKYMLSLSSYLSKMHSVDIFWDDKQIISRAEKRFPLDYSKLNFVKNIFISPLSFFEKKKIMQSYDLIIYLSDGSIPFLFGKKNVLHFQFPTPWVKGQNVLNKVKLSKIDSVICNSKYTKKYIDKTFNLSSLVLYPPCTVIESSEKKENMILTVGRLNVLSEHSDFKKLEKMISIFTDAIFPHHKEWKFVVVVTYVDEDKKVIERWKKQVEDLPIEIKTNVDHDSLKALYGKAKIYWHAAGFEEDLTIHPERAEHFGIAPVEAMSAGAVPVVINAGGIPEIVTSGKDGLIWNTASELVSETEKIINDDNFRKTLEKEAIKKSKDFSEESFEKNLYSIIEALS